MEICCPACDCTNIKKNGHIHTGKLANWQTGKQNHQCNECGGQFVQNSTQKRISDMEKELIGRLLLERISLHGICRVMRVSLRWLLEFIVSVYAELPDDLNFPRGRSESRKRQEAMAVNSRDLQGEGDFLYR